MRRAITIAIAIAALALPVSANASDTLLYNQMHAQMRAGVAFVNCSGQAACTSAAIRLMHASTTMIRRATVRLVASNSPSCLAASKRLSATNARLLGALSIWSQSGFDSTFKSEADTAEVNFARAMRPVLASC